MTRLVICLDGTWNRESSFTNVWRINVALRRSAEQRIYYDRGVGTKTTDYITGGGFGRGLSNNVLKAYLWLTEYYRPGDEVFVFGFSRGAYTARSLVGFLSLCGLLRPDAPVNIDAAFELYRRPGLGRHSLAAQAFRARNSLEPVHGRPPRVRFLGVFDTVGALGIPAAQVPLFEDYRWHKVHLSEIVEHAYHALAIDEHRELFKATLWTNRYAHQTVEQRWFVGAHANIGGGYLHDALSIRPLEWMQKTAKALGLQFDYDPCRVRDHEEFLAAPIADSWSEFLWGSYAKLRTVTHVPRARRFYRPIGTRQFWHPTRLQQIAATRPSWLKRAASRVQAKLVAKQLIEVEPELLGAVGEVIDYTVDQRVRRDPRYRPPNLKMFVHPSVWGS